jgi:hypothetical protein
MLLFGMNQKAQRAKMRIHAANLKTETGAPLSKGLSKVKDGA